MSIFNLPIDNRYFTLYIYIYIYICIYIYIIYISEILNTNFGFVMFNIAHSLQQILFPAFAEINSC